MKYPFKPTVKYTQGRLDIYRRVLNHMHNFQAAEKTWLLILGEGVQMHPMHPPAYATGFGSCLDRMTMYCRFGSHCNVMASRGRGHVRSEYRGLQC